MYSMFETQLEKLRNRRNFKAQEYLELKIQKINKFFEKEKLDAAVIGLSGGVDSAVVLKLLLAAQAIEGSPIKTVMGIIAPIYGEGVTDQEQATEMAQRLCFNSKYENGYYEHDETFSNLTWATINLTNAYEEIIDASAWKDNAWSKGQLASILRTPVFYYHAALLQAQGLNSLVVGTTNRDEGSYIGFYGKASDAMVDLQPIADIHKSEVYQIAKLLNVPQEIIDANPKGDVWNGECDFDMIGCSYDELEMFLLMREYNIVFSSSQEKECSRFNAINQNIESLHQKNAHKYKVGYPSRFVDVIPRAIPGGWQ